MLKIKHRPVPIQRLASILADTPAKVMRLAGITRAASSVLKVIVSHANKDEITNKKIRLSHKKICDATGYGRTTVSRAFACLLSSGFIEREPQRKIGDNEWSSPAFWLTDRFAKWVSEISMCSLFERNLPVSTSQNIKESAKIKTRHGICVCGGEVADETGAVSCALDSMSKGQVLHLLKIASKVGVKIQDAIAHIAKNERKIRNWYGYLKTTMQNGPIDYKQALKQKEKPRPSNDRQQKEASPAPPPSSKETAKAAIAAAFAILKKRPVSEESQAQRQPLLALTSPPSKPCPPSSA